MTCSFGPRNPATLLKQHRADAAFLIHWVVLGVSNELNLPGYRATIRATSRFGPSNVSCEIEPNPLKLVGLIRGAIAAASRMAGSQLDASVSKFAIIP